MSNFFISGELMDTNILRAFMLYFTGIFFIGIFALKKSRQATDFSLGGRSVNFWLTGISAHASDMSEWLFMAYPAIIYTQGLMGLWVAVGLTSCMLLNWRLVAPKLRIATEHYNSKTLPSFFESRFKDSSGILRITGALFCLLFFTFYISAGLVGLGRLFESILGINYFLGITIGILVVFYTLLGGFLAMAWIDFFQGLFLMSVILLVPILALIKMGGFESIILAAHNHNLPLTLIPDFSLGTIKTIIFAALGWGLGYFGQPHILTKFMGINNPKTIRSAQRIGITWQVLSMTGATLVGLVGMGYFAHGAVSKELVFVTLVKDLFAPFFAGFIVCAVIAAAINVIGAQILVSVAVLTEDFYRKILVKNSTLTAPNNTVATLEQKKLTLASRVTVFFICVLAYISACCTMSTQTINSLVYFSWAGLGGSFGPLVIMSLYSKMHSPWAALAGIISGGTTALLWPYAATIPTLIIAYPVSFAAMFLVWKFDLMRKQESKN
jgi:sodium/proline symporter